MCIRIALWCVFVVLLLVIGYLALAACYLSIPILGNVLSDCPRGYVQVYQTHNVIKSETEGLLAELRDMRVMTSLAPVCKDDETTEASLDQSGGSDSDIPSTVENISFNEAEEVIIILDTSGSMGSPLSAAKNSNPGSNDIVADLANALLGSFLRQLQNNGPSRIDASKRAILPILENPPGNKPVSLWGFQSCSAPPRKIYPDGNLSPATILGMLENNDATALADAISGIPAMLSDETGKVPSRGVNVLIFADGDEGCNKNVCNVAKNVKKQLPYTWIHIVALADDLQNLACVARETGGEIVRVDNSDDLKNILRYAADN